MSQPVPRSPPAAWASGLVHALTSAWATMASSNCKRSGRALQLRHRAPCLPAPVCLAPLHQQPMGVLASLGQHLGRIVGHRCKPIGLVIGLKIGLLIGLVIGLFPVQTAGMHQRIHQALVEGA